MSSTVILMPLDIKVSEEVDELVDLAIQYGAYKSNVKKQSQRMALVEEKTSEIYKLESVMRNRENYKEYLKTNVDDYNSLYKALLIRDEKGRFRSTKKELDKQFYNDTKGEYKLLTHIVNKLPPEEQALVVSQFTTFNGLIQEINNVNVELKERGSDKQRLENKKEKLEKGLKTVTKNLTKLRNYAIINILESIKSKARRI